MSQIGSDLNPPASPEFSIPAEPPGWPKVVGIISIVWGSLGILCGVCSALFTVSMGTFMERMMKFAAQQPQRGGGPVIPTTPMPAELQPGALSIIGAFIWPIGAIVLLMAGIFTVKRAANGRSMHLAYGALSLLGTLLGLAGAFAYQASSKAYMAAHPDDPWIKIMNQNGGLNNQVIQAAGLTCVAAIYPIFCLVWFGALGKRPEVGAQVQEPLM
jgi:hypothetical protein